MKLMNHPTQGISLVHLLEIGHEHKLMNMVTYNVVEKFVKKITKNSKSSYAEFITSSFVKHKADIFVSHAWKYRFGMVLNCLKEKFLDAEDKKDDVFV